LTLLRPPLRSNRFVPAKKAAAAQAAAAFFFSGVEIGSDSGVAGLNYKTLRQVVGFVS
jgi:hypothetical protein